MIACVGERTQDAPTPGIKCVRATYVYLDPLPSDGAGSSRLTGVASGAPVLPSTLFSHAPLDQRARKGRLPVSCRGALYPRTFRDAFSIRPRIPRYKCPDPRRWRRRGLVDQAREHATDAANFRSPGPVPQSALNDMGFPLPEEHLEPSRPQARVHLRGGPRWRILPRLRPTRQDGPRQERIRAPLPLAPVRGSPWQSGRGPVAAARVPRRKSSARPR